MSKVTRANQAYGVLESVCEWDVGYSEERGEVIHVAEFEIYDDQTSGAGEYRWRLRADNGEVIADSGEGYTEKSDCKHGIDLVKSLAPTADLQDLT